MTTHSRIKQKDLETHLLSLLQEIKIFPRRMLLQTPNVRATVPLLRGVWGAALYELDTVAYNTVFLGEHHQRGRTPLYLLRPAPPSLETAPAIDFILIQNGIHYDNILMRAWDIASGMGLTKKRERFFIKKLVDLEPCGEMTNHSNSNATWTLDQAFTHGTKDISEHVCRLKFNAPLRILRKKHLIKSPTLTDIVMACARRIMVFIPPDKQFLVKDFLPRLIDYATRIPVGKWEGENLSLVRYSGSQKKELEFRGITGYIELPNGAGELAPLLNAAQWLHLGKGSVVGMGQLQIELQYFAK